MTGPDDSQNSTRPISVAELLARNGTIGAPPVGGRRRRRRGDGSVSVAELTGEIPVIRDDHDERDEGEDRDDSEPATTRTRAVVDAEPVDTAPESAAERTDETPAIGSTDSTDTTVTAAAVTADGGDDDYAGAVADYAQHVARRETDEDLDFFTPPRRSAFAPRRFASDATAEQMSPDPLVEDVEDVEDEDAAVALAEPDIAEDTGDRDELPSYLRSTAGALFADDPARDARPGTLADLDDEDDGGVDLAGDLDEDTDDLDADVGLDGEADVDADLDFEEGERTAMSSFAHGALVVGQCVLAVAFGAGLFVAFDQLWKWNNIVALVLSVLVILGLVVGVRVVRKTEDIGSTLIAVAVGALVTLGPLALLQSG